MMIFARSPGTLPPVLAALRPLLHAEAAAEAPAAGLEPADLEQALWLRLLETTAAAGPPADPARWLASAVRAEVRGARRRRLREIPLRTADSPPWPPCAEEPRAAADGCPERRALAAEHRRTVRSAVRRMPARCRRLIEALLSCEDLTYREIAGELGISQGSLGPERSRCLGCLRRMLAAEVVAPEQRGKER